MTSVIIDKRYCGPPNSGNGGYVCGRLARHIPGGAEVTLRAPPPLDKQLDVIATDDGLWELRDGATVVATGRPASLELTRLEKASFDEACAAELLTPVKPHEHPLPTCFVCGTCKGAGRWPAHFCRTARASIPECFGCVRGDLDAGSDPDGRGRLRGASEFLWSALDCPTGYAASHDRESGGRTPILLGRMSATNRDHGRAWENAASSLPGRSAATAANALPRPRPMVKLEHCWPWLARRGLQLTAKCNSAAPKRRPLPESLTEMQPTKWGLMAKPGHDEKGSHFQEPENTGCFFGQALRSPFHPRGTRSTPSR